MDVSKKSENPNPRESASFLSVFCFCFTAPMFYKGYKKTLETEDLYDPLKGDRSAYIGDQLERQWKKHLAYSKAKNKKPSLLKTILRTFWVDVLKQGVLLAFMELVLRLCVPLLLGQLLLHFNPDGENTTSKTEALYYAGGIAGVNLACAFLINHYMLQCFHAGMKVRIGCCSIVYRKALKLSRTALGETASGKMVNLLSNDVSRFDIASTFLHYLWTAPTSAIIIMYLLYTQAGYAGLIGIGTVFLVVPIQAYTGKLSSKYRLQTAYKTDERVRLMDEIISGVQVIKMYAWEKPFAKLIEHARKLELKIVTKSSYVRGLYMTFNLFTTRVALFASLVSMITVMTYAAEDGSPIKASRVFVFSAYFGILAHTMSSMFVRGIAEIAEVLVAIRRLQAFLLYDEYESKVENILQNPNSNTNPDLNSDSKLKPNQSKNALVMSNVSSKWNPAATDSTLSKIDLTIPHGKLIGIIGPVGCGKSSLLQTVLGELSVSDGTLTVDGSLSYACQEAWVFAASVRQNIIFGNTYNRARYNAVVNACALRKDFEQFPHGDMTMVGDRGASLSGGQKARINLARAVYRDADIYLLDDPLSAVDTHVGKHLFDLCVRNYLTGKTRILVTHQLQYLKDADYIVVLHNGGIEKQGTYQEIVDSGILYSKMLTQEKESNKELDLNENSVDEKKRMSVKSTKSVESAGLNEDAELKAQTAEQSSKGTVEGSVFLAYFRYGANACLLIFVFLLFIFSQLAASGADYWVTFWVKQEEKTNNDIFTTNTCIYIYSGIIASLFFISFTRSLIFYRVCMRCSQRLHDSMFFSIIQTGMRFFNTNPSGRILNRFSKDIGAIDELLPKAVLDAAQVLLNMTGSIVLAAVVNPYSLIPIAILTVVFNFVKKIYLKTSKNVKRLEGITRSPVFTHLNATLQGLTTIRAYGAQDILQDEFDKHQDLHSGAWYMFISSSSTFGFSLDILCFIFISFVTFSMVLLQNALNLDGADVGLAITQSMQLTGIVQWGMRQSAEVSNQLMSVERVLEYSHFESEPNLEVGHKSPPKNWPDKGQIEFKEMYMRYAETEDHVLKDLNLTINPSEKVGIVGRTGAGKSSLISALFRLASVEGVIEIDEVNTADISLHDLRSNISIIPQDPVLFSGTMRYNLDPFDEYTDDKLWAALEEVELKDAIIANNYLESRVMDKGSNFSVGQRQLVCLARAILRNNKILMLDEATANVDPQTDALIQKTIREKFAHCTVLTVAHRLNTIMDSDRVLVMDAGRMIQFDHPHILCSDQEGTFYKMVEETGPAMTEQLCQVAKDAYENANQNKKTA